MSRTYHISDFAAFLRKYGDSARDRGGWEESARDDSRPSRSDRGTNQEFGQPRNGDDRWRTIYRVRNREYCLRESEAQTLIEVGKIRVIPADDLTRLGYRGDRSWMESDIQNLRRQGLIEQRSIEG